MSAEGYVQVSVSVTGHQKKVPESLALDLQVAVSCLVLLLGT